MENYYEYLEVDMNASQEDITSAVSAKSSHKNADHTKIREVKSILLNETAKKIYDDKLLNFILNKGKSKTSASSVSVSELLRIDNSAIHEKYVWIATAIFIVGIVSGLIFSVVVNYTINFLVMIAIMVLFYMDWKLLESHDKANFSKWWILFSPGYIAKRCKATDEGKKLLLIWLAIWVLYGVGTFIFNSGTALLERSACNVVTDIYHDQLHQYSQSCKSVTITDSKGKEHYGFAQLTDGSTRDISVSEIPNGQIYVTLE